MTPHNSNGSQWLLVEGKEGTEPNINNGFLYFSPLSIRYELPPGSWSIHCLSTEATEEQCKEVVEWDTDSDTWDNGTEYSKTESWFNIKNYETDEWDCDSFKESLQSLIRSLKLTGPVVILKKVKQ